MISGKVWDAVMREHLFAPLGLTHTGTLPEEAILHHAAVGHVMPAPDADLDVAPVWMLARACGPMGLINSTAADVLAFARMLMDDGTDGQPVVSAAALEAMQTPQVESPDRYTLGGSHWGLGLILFGWDGQRVYGHDGGTIGQSSRLRILPDAGTAICLLTNGGDAESVYREIVAGLASELAGVAMPPPLAAPETPPDVDLARFAGTYERLSLRYDLAVDGDRLVGTATASGPVAERLPHPVSQLELVPVDETTSSSTTNRRRSLRPRPCSTTSTTTAFPATSTAVPASTHARAARRTRSPSSFVRSVAPHATTLLGSVHLPTIPGRPPDPRDVGAGCAFAPRCPHADDRCRAEAPPLAPLAPGDAEWRAACWHPQGNG